MPSLQVYIDQAKHNEELTKYLLKSSFYDWSCVAAFYSAIHFVEAYFKKQPAFSFEGIEDMYRRNKNDPNLKADSIHDFRENMIKSKVELYSAYRHLRNTSELVRYLRNVQQNSFVIFNADDMKKTILEKLNIVKQQTGF